MENERVHLFRLVKQFRDNGTNIRLCRSVTPIQGVIIPGNEEVKEAAFELQKHNLDVRPILYPTVARGQERLRIVIHSFNTEQEIDQLLTILESRK
jgi:8-amino-7-oxononanoate synthase